VSRTGWIAVDLDGTLAHYTHWVAPDEIGDPIPAMQERVKGWLSDGLDVRIFTARVSDPEFGHVAVRAIELWCKEHLGQVLPVTNVKDLAMVELWDDRAITVEQNTGRVIGERQKRFTP
jgi:hypothetical protein